MKLLPVVAVALACLSFDAGGGAPRFAGTVSPIPAAMAKNMSSWRPGCPVPIRDLRLLTVTHWGFDRAVHRGELVVQKTQARPLLRVLRRLFAVRFPIQRMRPVDAYGSDDDRSMAANNTSAFNCRRVARSTSWSRHAYGLAIDINPVQNPSITGGVVSPPAGTAYANRKRWAPGMIHANDRVVRAFAAIGWTWGGYWRSPRDYQHFQRAR